MAKEDKKIRVRMLRDFDYSVDGVNLVHLKTGESYSLPKARAKKYIEKKVAEQDKAKDRSPETK